MNFLAILFALIIVIITTCVVKTCINSASLYVTVFKFRQITDFFVRTKGLVTVKSIKNV